ARRLLNGDTFPSITESNPLDFYSRKALELLPKDSAVWRVRAEALISANKVKAALDLLEEGLQQLPGSPDLWDTKALILENTGRVAEAEQSYLEAIRLAETQPARPKGEQARYLFHHSDLLRGGGRQEEAKAEFNRGLQKAALLRAGDWPMWGGADPG